MATGETDLQSKNTEVVATSESDLKAQNSEVVATGETDLQGKEMEVVASGETEVGNRATGESDLKPCEEIAGRVLSAWKDL